MFSTLTTRLAFRYAVLSFLIHSLFIFLTLVPGWRAEPLVSGDAVTYVLDANNILQHGVFSREPSPPYLWEPYRTPGYPLILTFSKWLTGDFEFALLLVAAIAGLAAWIGVRIAALLGCSRSGQHFTGITMSLLPNSLGLSAFLLTDALFGYLFLVWIYLLYMGFSKRNNTILVFSSLILFVLQAIKPTLNLGVLFIIEAGLLFLRSRKDLLRMGALAGLAVLLPMFFAAMNYGDHGIFSPSLLGVQAAREYLQVRYISEQSGREISQVTSEVRQQDGHSAEVLSQPRSFYGRLYLVNRAEVNRFIRQHPLDVLWLMAREMTRQFAAPQEFAFLVFNSDPPIWVRALGSSMTIVLWGSAGLGALKLTRKGYIGPAILLFSCLAFFLITGSISHFVGARLRFPADLLAVPMSAYGIFSYFPQRSLKKDNMVLSIERGSG